MQPKAKMFSITFSVIFKTILIDAWDSGVCIKFDFAWPFVSNGWCCSLKVWGRKQLKQFNTLQYLYLHLGYKVIYTWIDASNRYIKKSP